ncbi:MAG: type II toxin-antitoxin system HipA family toxin [Rubrivivax sp.]|nr:MAG: type II toxin-antitoxin system HipA family toxin [Rubrivivax sp.]
MTSVPVWVWLPGADEPTLAAHLARSSGPGRWAYTSDYLALAEKVAVDPISLRLVRRARGVVIPFSDGLPGVARDACPAGFGADRMTARSVKSLSPVELLEIGPPDSVGALEVCVDIDKKLSWRPRAFADLVSIIKELREDEPSSRSIGALNANVSTSLGGERPKITVVHKDKLWLAKMQDRADLPAMPAREFVTMTLAREMGLNVPDLDLKTIGQHQVFMIARFDRGGVPERSQRGLFASAHTVFDLEPSAVLGDPRRSYLNLADRMRIWCANGPGLESDLQELWKRMAFNALVGNVDDHPRNHGLLHDGHQWRLSPLFDVTPVMSRPPDEKRRRKLGGQVGLSMSTGIDNSTGVDASRLFDCCSQFGVPIDAAAQWLSLAAAHVAKSWEAMLRKTAGPVHSQVSQLDSLVEECRYSFGLSEEFATHPDLLARAYEWASNSPTGKRTTPAAGNRQR